MAMYHLFTPLHLQLLGQQQSHQHHFSDGVSPRQRSLILHNHGAPHFEQHPQQECPLDLVQFLGLDISSAGGLCAYSHRQNRGGQRGRGNSGPKSDMSPPVNGNTGLEGAFSKKNLWSKNIQQISPGENNGSVLSSNHYSEMDNSSSTSSSNVCDISKNKALENSEESTKISHNDSKGIKRQHEFHPKAYGRRAINSGWKGYYGNPTAQQSYDFGNTGTNCSIPQYDGGIYPSGIHGSKRRYQEDQQSLVFRGQRGRRSYGIRLGMAPESPLLEQNVLNLSDMNGITMPPPDRFLSRAHLIHVKDPPPALRSGGEWDKLSQGIWDKFIMNQQSIETFQKKIRLWKKLYLLIKKSFPRYGLYLVGSTMSGFGSNRSDVDMCLLVRYSEMDQRNEAVGHLEEIRKHLRRHDFINNPELIQAKVPILKFKDARDGLEVDLNCNNSVGIRNTHLLHCYSQLDWRVKPLVLIVKLWAHKHNINDAKNMTISSYSLALMVINYLQCGVSPPVLPCLHVMYQGKFSPHSDIHEIDVLEELGPYTSENNKSLGELFLDFLFYYGYSFDFSQDAISVRLAAKISIEDCRRVRTYKNDPHQWKYLCIEEPFDLTNTARSVYDRDVFERVKHVFKSSWRKLNDSKIIDSLFEEDKK